MCVGGEEEGGGGGSGDVICFCIVNHRGETLWHHFTWFMSMVKR